MIDHLKIQGYKSIDNININFKKLNLLVGGNSVGKSSIIQTLLIFSQDITERRDNISGHLISLDNFREIRNFKLKPKKIILELNVGKWNCKKEIYEDEDLRLMCDKKCIDCLLTDKKYERYLNVCSGLNYKNKFNYLSADRVGNLEIYNKNNLQETRIGLYGEYSIDYFQKNKDERVYKKLIINSEDTTLSGQVNYWLEYITGYVLKTEKIDKTDYIRAYYSKDGFDFRGRSVGAGLGYLISMLILCLSCKPDHIILIENPEIHLHPKAQSLLLDFFAFVSSAGIQIILETHSDHIFNGARIAINENKISKEDVSINYFDVDENYITVHTEIEINDNGRVLNHTEGLFEQFDLDIDRLLGL